MREIVDGVYQLSGFPNNLINMYLVGDILIDAGIKSYHQRILKDLGSHKITVHALTHVHPDHQGATHTLCETLNIPLWCSADEVDAMETGDFSQQIPKNLITSVQHHIWTGKPHPVSRGLQEGDDVADFVTIETSGHSPGHLSFWRESDRTLIMGDVARNINFLTLQEELGEPPEMFTVDIIQNRESLKKLADLNPKTILFGHGKPLLDGAKFVDFVSRLVN